MIFSHILIYWFTVKAIYSIFQAIEYCSYLKEFLTLIFIMCSFSSSSIFSS